MKVYVNTFVEQTDKGVKLNALLLDCYSSSETAVSEVRKKVIDFLLNKQYEYVVNVIRENKGNFFYHITLKIEEVYYRWSVYEKEI